MKRRRFLYWFSASLFGIGEVLRIEAFDRLAAATMNFNGRSSSSRSGGGDPYNRTGKAIDNGRKPTVQGYSNFNTVPSGPVVDNDVDDPERLGEIEPRRRARQGRPPSHWIRSLDAEELSTWLKTINPPPSGVTGMTFQVHLIRDHLFLAEKIAGLQNNELAKLHAAAHAGY